MSKGDTFENDWLKLIFNATAIANMADNAAASPLTNLYIGLYSADPGEAGTQSTSEISYTGYARVAVARTSGGWTITGNQAANAAIVAFPQCTGGSATALFFGVGTLISGTGKLLYSGSITSLSISNGITPTAAAGAIVCTED